MTRLLCLRIKAPNLVVLELTSLIEEEVSPPKRLELFPGMLVERKEWFAVGGAPWRAISNDLQQISKPFRTRFPVASTDGDFVWVRDKIEDYYCEIDPMAGVQGRRLQAAGPLATLVGETHSGLIEITPADSRWVCQLTDLDGGQLDTFPLGTGTERRGVAAVSLDDAGTRVTYLNMDSLAVATVNAPKGYRWVYLYGIGVDPRGGLLLGSVSKDDPHNPGPDAGLAVAHVGDRVAEIISSLPASDASPPVWRPDGERAFFVVPSAQTMYEFDITLMTVTSVVERTRLTPIRYLANE